MSIGASVMVGPLTKPPLSHKKTIFRPRLSLAPPSSQTHAGTPAPKSTSRNGYCGAAQTPMEEPKQNCPIVILVVASLPLLPYKALPAAGVKVAAARMPQWNGVSMPLPESYQYPGVTEQVATPLITGTAPWQAPTMPLPLSSSLSSIPL